MPNHVVKSIGLVSPNRIYIVRDDITDVKLGNLKLLCGLLELQWCTLRKKRLKIHGCLEWISRRINHIYMKAMK